MAIVLPSVLMTTDKIKQVKKLSRSFHLGGFLQRCFHFFICWQLFQGGELVLNISFEMLKTKHEIEIEIITNVSCLAAEMMCPLSVNEAQSKSMS